MSPQFFNAQKDRVNEGSETEGGEDISKIFRGRKRMEII